MPQYVWHKILVSLRQVVTICSIRKDTKNVHCLGANARTLCFSKINIFCDAEKQDQHLSLGASSAKIEIAHCSKSHFRGRLIIIFGSLQTMRSRLLTRSNAHREQTMAHPFDPPFYTSEAFNTLQKLFLTKQL